VEGVGGGKAEEGEERKGRGSSHAFCLGNLGSPGEAEVRKMNKLSTNLVSESEADRSRS